MYYKVVDQDLCSAICTNELQVQYIVGEYVQTHDWLEARGFGLCVFEALERAKYFASCERNPRIFECEIKNPRQPINFISGNTMTRFLAELSWEKLGRQSSLWPIGTIMCDAVKLVQECTIK